MSYAARFPLPTPQPPPPLPRGMGATSAVAEEARRVLELDNAMAEVVSAKGLGVDEKVRLFEERLARFRNAPDALSDTIMDTTTPRSTRKRKLIADDDDDDDDAEPAAKRSATARPLVPARRRGRPPGKSTRAMTNALPPPPVPPSRKRGRPRKQPVASVPAAGIIPGLTVRARPRGSTTVEGRRPPPARAPRRRGADREPAPSGQVQRARDLLERHRIVKVLPSGRVSVATSSGGSNRRTYAKSTYDGAVRYLFQPTLPDKPPSKRWAGLIRALYATLTDPALLGGTDIDSKIQRYPVLQRMHQEDRFMEWE